MYSSAKEYNKHLVLTLAQINLLLQLARITKLNFLNSAKNISGQMHILTLNNRVLFFQRRPLLIFLKISSLLWLINNWLILILIVIATAFFN